MRQEFVPLFDQIAVRELDPPEERRSGLVLPPQHADRHPPQEGIVVAVGEGMDWWQSVGFVMPVSPGDKVMFHYAHGTYIEVDEERLLVLRVGQLLGIVRDVPEPSGGLRANTVHADGDGA